MDEPILQVQEIAQVTDGVPLRSYYGDERRRLHAPAFYGVERRIPDPPCEQDWDREPAPN